MININFTPTPKQNIAWNFLNDKTTIHILYGGSAGSGKSYFGCMWLLISCLKYPGSRWVMGRSRLQTLKRTTLRTFIDICRDNKFTEFKINAHDNVIKFDNGSEIIMMDLFSYPNDPDYDRLGSLEITGALIDELSEVGQRGFQVLTSRVRYKLKEFGLTPKILCCSNPYNSWIKNYFYIPWSNKTEDEHIKFVPALSTDNPHLPDTYISTLEKTLDTALKARLLHGDWNFASDEYSLFEYIKLQQTFYNEFFVNTDNGKYYLCVDVADLGGDSTVISLWTGWRCEKLIRLKKYDTVQIVRKINEIRQDFNIPIANIIIDSTGVGAGVASMLKGCIRYMAAASPIQRQGYRNIKTQLMYKFAEKINAGEVYFNFDYNDDLIQEAVNYKKEFTDSTAYITSKEEIKRKIGRSPDTLDSLYLRAYFEFNIKHTVIKII